MNNFAIASLAKELNIKNFLGCFMRDELLKLKLPLGNFYLIYNFQTSKENGSHWCFACRKENKNYHGCPFGSDPCRELIECLGVPITSSTFRIQNPAEISCGLYCVLLMHLIEKGSSFEDAVLDLINGKYSS